MTNNTQQEAELLALKIRKRIFQGARSSPARGAHFGASLSCTDILASAATVWNLDSVLSPDSTRITLSKGHACLALYALLLEKGLISEHDFASIQTNGSIYPGHPLINREKQIYFSTGTLGQGLANAVGQALFHKLKVNESSPKIIAVVGDGECSEGIFYESLMLASQYRLSNLLVVIDNNGYQQTGATSEISNSISWMPFLKSLGAHCFEVSDGNDVHSLISAFDSVKESTSDSPHVLVANTRKGYGISFMQDSNDYHYGSLTSELHNQALTELAT